MSVHSEEIVLDMAYREALRVVRRALATLQWDAREQADASIVCKLPTTWTTNPGRISIVLEDKASNQTTVTLDGSIGGFGPIQARHLRDQIAALRNHIRMTATEQIPDSHTTTQPAMSDAGATRRLEDMSSISSSQENKNKGLNVAALVIGIFVGVASFLQSCVLSGMGSLAGDANTKAEAGWGLIMSLLAVFGSAFVFGRPKTALWLFGTGSAFGIVGGATAGTFRDLLIWGGLLTVPTFLAYRASQGTKKG